MAEAIASDAVDPVDRREPRQWVIVGGAAMAACWLAVILAVPLGAPEWIFLGVLGMVPINLLWRWKYWRAKKTPTINVMGQGRRLGLGGAADPSSHRYDATTHVLFGLESQKSTASGAMLQRQVNKGCGGMVAGFLFPMRDAVAEWRWVRGKGKGARI